MFCPQGPSQAAGSSQTADRTSLPASPLAARKRAVELMKDKAARLKQSGRSPSPAGGSGSNQFLRSKRKTEQLLRTTALSQVYRLLDANQDGAVGESQIMGLAEARWVGQDVKGWTRRMNSRLMMKMGADIAGCVSEGCFNVYFNESLPGEQGEFDAAIKQFMECAERFRISGQAVSSQGLDNEPVTAAGKTKLMTFDEKIALAKAEHRSRSRSPSPDKGHKDRSKLQREAGAGLATIALEQWAESSDVNLQRIAQANQKPTSSTGEQNDSRLAANGTGGSKLDKKAAFLFKVLDVDKSGTLDFEELLNQVQELHYLSVMTLTLFGCCLLTHLTDTALPIPHSLSQPHPHSSTDTALPSDVRDTSHNEARASTRHSADRGNHAAG